MSRRGGSISNLQFQNEVQKFRSLSQNVEELKEISPDHLPQITDLLSSPHSDIRMGTAELIAPINSKTITSSLFPFILKEDNPFVGATLVTSLKHGYPQVVIPFITKNLIPSQEGRILANALEILSGFKKDQKTLFPIYKAFIAHQDNRVLVNSCLGYFPKNQELILKYFQKLLLGMDFKLKEGVIYALKKIHSPVTFEMILKVMSLKECPDTLIASCMSALCAFDDPRVQGILLGFLNQPNSTLILSSLEGLSKLGLKKNIGNQLVPLLYHPNEWVRGAAREYIGTLSPDDFSLEAKNRALDLNFILNFPLFKGVPQEALERVLGQSHPLKSPGGEKLYSGGEDLAYFTLLKSGCLICEQSITTHSSGNGEGFQHPLRIKPGQGFGEFFILSGQKNTLKVTAEFDSEALLVPRAVLLDLVQEFPRIFQSLYFSSQPKEDISQLEPLNPFNSSQLKILLAVPPCQMANPSNRIREFGSTLESEARSKLIHLTFTYRKNPTGEYVFRLTEKINSLFPLINHLSSLENGLLVVKEEVLIHFFEALKSYFDLILLEILNHHPGAFKRLGSLCHKILIFSEFSQGGDNPQKLLKETPWLIPFSHKKIHLFFDTPVERDYLEQQNLKKEPDCYFFPTPEEGGRAQRGRRHLVSLARFILRRRVGVALSSGSAYGVAHMGVLIALEEAGIPIEVISGTNIGALAGATFCLGFRNQNIIKIFEEFSFQKLNEIKNFNFGMFFGKGSGFLKGESLEKLLKNLFKNNSFQNLKTRLVVTTSDLATGEPVEIDQGPLHKALSHSLILPILYNASDYQGKILVDGGLTDPVPISPLKNRGCEIIISSNVLQADGSFQNFSLKEFHDRANILNVFLSTMDHFKNQLGKKSQHTPHFEIHPNCSPYDSHDFKGGKFFVEQGYQATQKIIPELIKTIYGKK